MSTLLAGLVLLFGHDFYFGVRFGWEAGLLSYILTPFVTVGIILLLRHRPSGGRKNPRKRLPPGPLAIAR